MEEKERNIVIIGSTGPRIGVLRETLQHLVENHPTPLGVAIESFEMNQSHERKKIEEISKEIKSMKEEIEMLESMKANPYPQDGQALRRERRKGKFVRYKNKKIC